MSHTPTLRHEAQGSKVEPERANPGERTALRGAALCPWQPHRERVWGIPSHLQGSPLSKPYWKPEGMGTQMLLPTPVSPPGHRAGRKVGLGTNEKYPALDFYPNVFSATTKVSITPRDECWAWRTGHLSSNRMALHSSAQSLMQPSPCTPHWDGS